VHVIYRNWDGKELTTVDELKSHIKVNGKIVDFLFYSEVITEDWKKIMRMFMLLLEFRFSLGSKKKIKKNLNN
jgi:hypothetical protein